MPVLIAVLDANVLIPAALRDTLLRATGAGLYEARWTEDILAEVERNLISTWHWKDAQVQRFRSVLSENFPRARISGHAAITDTMPNDPKDRHVLAAAVVAQAQVIVTLNLRDFPEAALLPLGIVAESPDIFLTRLFIEQRAQMLDILGQQAQALHHPPVTIKDIVNNLALHAPTFARLVRAELAD